ncbi:hypothetical protein D3C81_441960 [compost metagenome]
MKNLTKQQMLSLYVATEMQIAVTATLNPRTRGVLVTVEESANFAERLNDYGKSLHTTHCLVVRHIDDFDDAPFAVLPINGRLVYEIVEDAMKQGHPSLIDKLFAK